MTETEFIKHFSANSNQLMWFLGAGVSRTAGMPSATDLVWDLKFRYYCLEENQSLDTHDINNDIIRNKVQYYMDSKGYPKLWSPEEYSFFFELTFGNDYASQQRYLAEKFCEENISLNIGQRALAGLIGLNKTRVIFTTNFDNVIETAYSQVCSSTLSTYHLEGSYAALEALNNERYPIYAKIHGDFRYQSIKNLSSDLKSNDAQIQKCFISASNRFGIVVSGYSGRDINVMSMFREAIQHDNAFPHGLFWTVTDIKKVSSGVKELVFEAQNAGINAHIIETGTFDSLLSKIWKQIPNKSKELDEKVRTAVAVEVNIPLPDKGTKFPVLRSNALPIVSIPEKCAFIETKEQLTFHEIKELLKTNKSNCIINRTDKIIGWGSEEEFSRALGKDMIQNISILHFDNPVDLIIKNKGYHAFFERALVTSIIRNKPFLLRHGNGYILAIDPQKVKDPIFIPLINALKGKDGTIFPISGKNPMSKESIWSEGIKLKMECRNSSLYLLLRPIIWIEPQSERFNSVDFIKSKVRYRYNTNTHLLLNAWIQMLFGSINRNVEISCFDDTNYPYSFMINSRTAFSHL